MSVDLKNCFGIKSLKHTFNFQEDNVIAIYARNGMMKTSFAKTFKKIENSHTDDIKDCIFDIPGTVDVKIDGIVIKPDDIFVINSFESSYQSNITSLLIDDSIKIKLVDILKKRDKLFKEISKISGIKFTKSETHDLEDTIIKDLNFQEKSFLSNLEKIKGREPIIDISSIKYNNIFKDAILKKIRKSSFQTKIKDFITKSDEIYKDYAFLKKGKLSLPKLRAIQSSLEVGHYFVNNNKIVLAGMESIDKIDSLNEKINEIENKLCTTEEFKEIDKLLNDVGGSEFHELIENNPELIEFLDESKLNDLKELFWISYFSKNKESVDELYSEFILLSTEIDAIDLDNTKWKHALEIFNKRFSVPFKMNVVNLKETIIGENLPMIDFVFQDGARTQSVNREELDNLKTLSQGENRALYLLNVIFDIEKNKELNKETIFIIDDIADSFDYKNKYAIIEYLYELAQDTKNKLIIMSHNFDFYRTVSSRLGIVRHNRFFTGSNAGNITLNEEHYQKEPFKAWKKDLNEKNIIALIPFVRNLAEYGRDYNISATCANDFTFLTELLHEKQNTNNIEFGDLNTIYNQYLGVNIPSTIISNKKIIDAIYDICNNMATTEKELEDKIILSIGIRHKAEKYMIEKINNHSGLINWVEKNKITPFQPVDYIRKVIQSSNQTRTLFNGCSQICSESEIKILESVEIMTPESIHINSFMYEPIIDMDINELLSLYSDVKTLIP